MPLAELRLPLRGDQSLTRTLSQREREGLNVVIHPPIMNSAVR